MSKQDQPTPALDSAIQDRMGHALLTLAKHVWTLQDRQRVLEAQLTAAGIKIDLDLSPNASLQETLNHERDNFINELLGALINSDDISG